MLPRGLLPVVADVLGADIPDVTADHVRAVIDAGLPELDELDAKGEHYKSGKDGSREFAKDISAMANHRGGVLLIGAAEPDQDRPVWTLTPVEIGDEVERRYQGIASTRCAPPLSIRFLSIRTEDDGRGVLLILTTPTPALGPHAVRDGASLSYHRRAHSTTRELTEPEVRQAYAESAAFVSRRQKQAETRLTAARGLLDDGLWLVSIATPDIPGRWPVNADRVGEVRSWKGPQILGPGGVRTPPQEVSTIVGGVQQLRLSDEAKLTDQYHAIYDDGSALGAVS